MLEEARTSGIRYQISSNSDLSHDLIKESLMREAQYRIERWYSVACHPRTFNYYQAFGFYFGAAISKYTTARLNVFLIVIGLKQGTRNNGDILRQPHSYTSAQTHTLGQLIQNATKLPCSS